MYLQLPKSKDKTQKIIFKVTAGNILMCLHKHVSKTI